MELKANNIFVLSSFENSFFFKLDQIAGFKMLENLKFKLKSSKVLFIIGVWVTIVIVGFGVFKESKNEGNSLVQESKALFFGEN